MSPVGEIRGGWSGLRVLGDLFSDFNILLASRATDSSTCCPFRRHGGQLPTFGSVPYSFFLVRTCPWRLKFVVSGRVLGII